MRNDVAHEALVDTRAGHRDHGRLDRRVHAHDGLDLARLDPDAADLDLIVDAPEELDVAVRKKAAAIAGREQAGLGVSAERIGDELLRRQLGIVEIAAGQPVARDVDLSRHPDRHGIQVAVEQIDARVVDRPADRDPFERASALDDIRGHVARDFRRAVQVDERGGGERFRKAPGQLGRDGLAAGHPEPQRGELAPRCSGRCRAGAAGATAPGRSG